MAYWAGIFFIVVMLVAVGPAILFGLPVHSTTVTVAKIVFVILAAYFLIMAIRGFGRRSAAP
jgi:hypothetical protein